MKIFAAFDFSGTAETALRWIKGLSAAGPCEIVVGYVDWPLGEAARLGITGQFLGSHNPPQVQRILERELAERAVPCWGKVSSVSASNQASAVPTRDWSRWRARSSRTSLSPCTTSGTARAASRIRQFRAACCATRR